tara:strand:- start:2828 stop:3046 length:219 start_codon:yes stop_codon:yes gene_type:complete
VSVDAKVSAADTSAVVDKLAQADATTVFVPSAASVVSTKPVAEPIELNVINVVPPADTVMLSDVAAEPSCMM